MKNKTVLSRRNFLKITGTTVGGMAVMPSIVPSSVRGPYAPSNRINIGFIGMGRIAREHNFPGVAKHPQAHILAVCDLDSKRLEDARRLVETFYAEKRGEKYTGVRTYANYRELLADKEIDAVVISTPDHWHGLIAIEAALAGKHIYLEKPCTLTHEEGRILSNVVHRTGVVFQLGTQQRSWEQFRRACELVRNGRIGELKHIQVGLPVDPSCGEEPEMPVPPNLNYEMWLGPARWAPYTEKRVHPQHDYSRPGWLRIEDYCLGMITGWGVHHMDIVHWGMGTEYTGPVTISGRAEFPQSGLWTVHGKYKVDAYYANGVHVEISDDFPNGVRFEGTEGWIFVTRGNYSVTSSDPNKKGGHADSPLQASNPSLLTSKISDTEIHLYKSTDHHGNWLSCIQTGLPPLCPVETGHRSTAVCIISHIAMKLGRTLHWDPLRERFINDDEANAMLSRHQRYPYVIDVR